MVSVLIGSMAISVPALMDLLEPTVKVILMTAPHLHAIMEENAETISTPILVNVLLDSRDGDAKSTTMIAETIFVSMENVLMELMTLLATATLVMLEDFAIRRLMNVRSILVKMGEPVRNLHSEATSVIVCLGLMEITVRSTLMSARVIHA